MFEMLLLFAPLIAAFAILAIIETFLDRFAASRLMTCPRCGVILDCSETVVLTDTADNTVTMCARCYGRPIGGFTSGSVTVMDGRELWPARGKGKGAKGRLWRYKT